MKTSCSDFNGRRCCGLTIPSHFISPPVYSLSLSLSPLPPLPLSPHPLPPSPYSLLPIIPFLSSLPPSLSPPLPSQPEACKLATQLQGDMFPITRKPKLSIKVREITDDERKYSVFQALRVARADAKLVGVREKRAKQKADDEKNQVGKK